MRIPGLLLVAAVLLPCAVARGQDGERVHLVVLHTNDVHGQVLPRPATWLAREDPPLVGGLARVAAYVNEVRAETAASGAELLVLDAGDWFQGTPEGLVGSGRPFVHALGLIGYDAMCVGNHEFDYGTLELAGQLGETQVPALLANVRDPEGRFIPGTEPFTVVEKGGIRIALVGLLTTSTPEITDRSAQSLTFLDPALALGLARLPLQEEADWILPLTHLGLKGDKELARAFPDLDLIVGGHSHTYLREGVREGDTLIVQAGSKASGVGRVDVWFDKETREFLEASARIVDLEDEPKEEFRDEALEELCAVLVERSDARMTEVVGQITSALTRTRHPIRSSTAGNFITDAMRARTGAEVALQNRGGIRADVQEGDVTRRQLFEILPFGNHLVTLKLRGSVLEALLRRAIEGGAHTGLELSGMIAEVRLEEGGAKLVRLIVGGEPLDPETMYRVTTNSFLAGGGDGYMELAQATERTVDPTILRDLLEQGFASAEVLSPMEDARYRVVE